LDRVAVGLQFGSKKCTPITSEKPALVGAQNPKKEEVYSHSGVVVFVVFFDLKFW